MCWFYVKTKIPDNLPDGRYMAVTVITCVNRESREIVQLVMVTSDIFTTNVPLVHDLPDHRDKIMCRCYYAQIFCNCDAKREGKCLFNNVFPESIRLRMIPDQMHVESPASVTTLKKYSNLCTAVVS